MFCLSLKAAIHEIVKQIDHLGFESESEGKVEERAGCALLLSQNSRHSLLLALDTPETSTSNATALRHCIPELTRMVVSPWHSTSIQNTK